MATATNASKTPQKTSDGLTVLTPEFRVSFPAVFQPKAFEGQEAKYSVQMLFKKNTDLSALKKAARLAIEAKWPDPTKRPKNLRTPFRDGADKADMEGYGPEIIFVGASSKQRPGLVDQRLKPIIDTEAFYAGCYARAQIRAFAYDKAGNRGVSFGLQNLQFLRDGDPFSGRTKAEDAFDAVEDDSENPENYDNEDMSELGL